MMVMVMMMVRMVTMMKMRSTLICEPSFTSSVPLNCDDAILATEVF